MLAIKKFLFLFVLLIYGCSDDKNDNTQLSLQVRELSTFPGMLSIDPTASRTDSQFLLFNIKIYNQATNTLVNEFTIEDDFKHTILHKLVVNKYSTSKGLNESQTLKNVQGNYLVVLTAIMADRNTVQISKSITIDSEIWHTHQSTSDTSSTNESDTDDTSKCDTNVYVCSINSEDDDYIACVIDLDDTDDTCLHAKLGTDGILGAAQTAAESFIDDNSDNADFTWDFSPDKDSPLAIAAYGAAGADGGEGSQGGAGGAGGMGGFTQVITSINEYRARNNDSSSLYFYVGEKGGSTDYQSASKYASGGDGGSATILAFSKLTDTIQETDLISIASGGGGGASSSDDAEYSSSNLVTLVPIYTLDATDGNQTLLLPYTDYTYAAADSVELIDFDKSCADAGSSDGSELGGRGGAGNSNYPTWSNSDDITTSLDGDGAGGDANYDESNTYNSGAGGGGAGGGNAGEGGGAGDLYYCAGAGGGSMVTSSTSDIVFTTGEEDSNNSDGKLHFYFINDKESYEYCELDEDDNTKIVCTYAADEVGSRYTINLAILASALEDEYQVTIDEDTTPIWIQAYGTASNQSYLMNHNDDTDNLGLGGFAQTITSLSGFQELNEDSLLYFYVAEQIENNTSIEDLNYYALGGASTIVSFTDDLSTDTALWTSLLLVAGGGGGAATGAGSDGNSYYYNSGYDGGTAITTGNHSHQIGEGKGPAGGGGDDCDLTYACGGSQSGGNAGQDGIGGLGGLYNSTDDDYDLFNTWSNATPILANDDDGQGGEVSTSLDGCSDTPEYKGIGGGGFGGGGSGSCSNDSTHAGSGGGSFSYKFTLTDGDDEAPTSMPDNDSYHGKVVITFNTNTDD